MKDEVKITVIATGFKDTPLGRNHHDSFGTSALHNRSNGSSAYATYEVASVSVSRARGPGRADIHADHTRAADFNSRVPCARRG